MFANALKIPRVGAFTRPTLLAIPLAALMGLDLPGAAGASPVPDAEFEAFASAVADAGPISSGGPGSDEARLDVTRGLASYQLFADVFGIGGPETIAGMVDFGAVRAAIISSGSTLTLVSRGGLFR
jgi:hypothetical protein